VKTVRLALALHNHQPVGNLDHVVERAMEDAYLPFLSVMEEFPQLPFTLHISGCLFEWAEHNAPEYLDRVGSLVKSGTVEILGGGRAEPIFTMLPERDVTGQIRSFTAQLEKRFGVRPEGAWLPERVWEQQLTGLFERAGVRYTVVDDFHMKRAGVTGRDLYNVFLTEDRGSVLRLFPSCETLRYTIPFRKPEETLDFLRSVASETEDRLVVYADDGEKFGTWPGTKKHVYEDGWLARFFGLLSENTDWIRLTTLGEACRELERPTRIYLPDSSYREMLEWALPSRRLAEFHGVESALERSNLLDAVRPFLGGGFWRNFKVKYAEALNLYARMMEVSEAVAGLPEGDASEEARLELYRGQCNCVYWHGVFGGLYLPHLRFAAYKHLLGAERICRGIPGSAPPPPVEVRDFDFDGRPEAILADGPLKGYVRPHAGGHLFELDLLDAGFNACASMTRRFEDYHEDVDAPEGGEGLRTIHDKRPTKGKGVKEGLAYDGYNRESAVDHFFGPGTDLEGIDKGTYPEAGDFHSGDYGLRETGDGARLLLSRIGTVKVGEAVVPVSIAKEFSILSGGGGLRIAYTLGVDARLGATFGVEFNFSMLSGSTDDRYFYGPDGGLIGPLGLETVLNKRSFLGLTDRWQKLRIEIHVRPEASFFLLPVKTVSQSEAGFELLYQQSCVIPWWPLDLKAGERFEPVIEIRCGTGV